MLCGDFNQILDINLDKKGGKERNKLKKSSEVINKFLEQTEWNDVWCALHPDIFQFTWKKSNPLIMSHIDYMLMPMGTFSLVQECNILPAVFSDHCAIICKLCLSETMRGPGLWKFNTSHLSKKEYVDQINKVLDHVEFRYNELNPLNRWEMLKMDVREETIQFSNHFAVTRKQKIKALQKQLESANKRLAMINLKALNAIELIQKINTKIDNISIELNKGKQYNAQGAILRAKAQWMAQGEHNSKYFFSLEKRNLKSKTMNQTYDQAGQLVNKTDKILEVQAKFYERLYTKDTQINCKIDSNPEATISELDQIILENPIEMKELQNALKSMAMNKSPGTDGFQVNFYVMFWEKLDTFLLEAFNYAIINKMMHKTAREGVISLLPKQDRDLKYVKNWRPIVLLNTDSKILSKVVANRIKLVLPSPISSDQTGFLKNRYIAENLLKLIDAMVVAEDNNIPAIIVSVDFEKAFDRIEYRSVVSIMKWFSFGPYMTGLVELLFTNFKLATINNGYTSDYFTPMRGLFQGNPISSDLFILTIELLAVQLKRNQKVQGLKIDDEHELLLTQFADDLGLMLKYDETLWTEAVHEFNKFQSCTGSKISYDKSTVYRIGSLKDSNVKFYSACKLQWTNKPFKVLGIYLTTNTLELIKLNVEPHNKNRSDNATVENERIILVRKNPCD